jgi:hypothetical protein
MKYVAMLVAVLLSTSVLFSANYPKKIKIIVYYKGE